MKRFRVDLRVGFRGDKSASDAQKITQDDGESKEDFVGRIVNQLFESLDQLEEGQSDES